MWSVSIEMGNVWGSELNLGSNAFFGAVEKFVLPNRFLFFVERRGACFTAMFYSFLSWIPKGGFELSVEWDVDCELCLIAIWIFGVFVVTNMSISVVLVIFAVGLAVPFNEFACTYDVAVSCQGSLVHYVCYIAWDQP